MNEKIALAKKCPAQLVFERLNEVLTDFLRSVGSVDNMAIETIIKFEKFFKIPWDIRILWDKTKTTEEKERHARENIASFMSKLTDVGYIDFSKFFSSVGTDFIPSKIVNKTKNIITNELEIVPFFFTPLIENNEGRKQSYVNLITQLCTTLKFYNSKADAKFAEVANSYFDSLKHYNLYSLQMAVDYFCSPRKTGLSVEKRDVSVPTVIETAERAEFYFQSSLQLFANANFVLSL